MQKYVYRNKDNQFFNYYLENGNLIEHQLYTQNYTPKTLAKSYNPNFSITFSKSERPNIFFLDKDNILCMCKFQENIWVQETLHNLNFKPEFFKVLEFQNNYALLYCIKTNESRIFDTYIMYIGEHPVSPKFLTKVYSHTSELFSIEEIALNHYAFLYKTIDNKKIHLNYMEINNIKQSHPVFIAYSELSLQDETFLFDEHAYCLYTKKRNYSQQLCLKVISNFNEVPTREYLVFEGKNIENPNIFIANNKLHVFFITSKNIMSKVSDDLLNINFGKINSESENGLSIEKARFLGFSLKEDNFRANNLYLNNKKQFSVLDKYCNLPPKHPEVQKHNTKESDFSISQYELRNKALLEENRNLKKQLRKYEN